MTLSFEQLPTLNAVLNSLSAVLLVTGYLLIRRGHESAHKVVMLSAFGVSILFLASYLIYHFQIGSVRFEGPPTIRTIYLIILFTHIPLAASVPVLASITIFLAFRDRRLQHRRIARWTLPIWLYVSVTGVIIYLMLYQIYPSGR